MKVKITFTEPILGTSPSNEEIYREFIGSKAPDAATVEDEVAALGVEEVTEKSKTVFGKLDDGTPFLWDYQIKGFFKGSARAMNRIKSSETKKLKAFIKIIDELIFVEPRKIPICLSGTVGECQRPLRAQTAQGERVSLAISEEIHAGSTVEFTITDLSGEHEKAIREWLDYGRFNGIGQWRNSGKGRFTWEEIT